MKKYFIVFTILSISFFWNEALCQSSSQTRNFTNEDWREMVDNYDGLFRNHKKTDGIIIDPKKLLDIVNRFPGKKTTLLYARYPKGTVVKGKKGRVTLVLRIQNGNNINDEEYIDMGGDALCPEPECAPKN